MSKCLDLDSFIEKSKKRQQQEYDYSCTTYDSTKGYDQIVKIRCFEHGEFETKARNHVKGRGCYHCGRNKIITARRKGVDQWKKEFSELYKNKYDYRLWVDECGVHDKFKVICPTHGTFETTKSNHRQGKGCASCSRTGFKPSQPAYLYVLHTRDKYTKIGITKNKPHYRMLEVTRTSGSEFYVFCEFYHENGKEVYQIEQQALKHFSQYYSQPKEIFDGSTECFYDLDPEIAKLYIEKLFSDLISVQHSTPQYNIQ
jgi:hypothetical protein